MAIRGILRTDSDLAFKSVQGINERHDAAGFITGQTLFVDGSASLGR
jgi:hypothetical protein